jgi:hypothetical protein
LLAACAGTEVTPIPTQIMLEIESNDSALRASLGELHVAVALRRGDNVFDMRRAVVVPASALHWPVQIPVTPRTAADASESFEVLVQARGAGVVLAETRAFVPFVKNQHRTLRLQLFSCPGHPPGFTCADEGCRGPGCQVCAADGRCVVVGSVDPNQLPQTPGADDDAGQTSPTDAGSLPDAGMGRDAAAQPDAAAHEAGTPALDAGLDAALDAALLDAGQDASADAGTSDGGAVTADASADASTACQAGTKRCAAACIPQAQCCADADCSGGMLCRQGSCKRWCDAQSRPVDVLAADYQCVDSDLGLAPVSIWVPSTSSANVAASSDRAYSAPNSLRCVDTAYTRWTTQAAAPPESIELSAMINPTPHPSDVTSVPFISLVCFFSGDFDPGPALRHCLMYSFKSGVDNVSSYTGLWIETSGGAGAVREYPLYDPAAPSTPLNFNWNAWNTLSMKVDNTQLQLVLNGKTATIGGGAGPSGKVAIILGSGDWAVNYDNVLVSIRR